MDDVFVIGVHGTDVGRHLERSFTDLVEEAWTGALAEAGIEPERITHAWFGNYMMDFFGGRMLRGQEVVGPLVQRGVFPDGVAIVNVEGGCASGSLAFSSACQHVRLGISDVALAFGAEKMHDTRRPGNEVLEWMEGGVGGLNPQAFWGPIEELAADVGTEVERGGDRSVAMDVYAIWARSHMAAYGTRPEHIAAAAAKNHTNSVGNPRAQYRFPMTVDDVLADRTVCDPLTRAMCAPRGDAAAAVIVCNARALAGLPSEVRDRALRVRGHAVAGARRDARWDGERAPVRAIREVYAQTGLGPADVDLVELHDATSFAELHLVEDLGLCARGEGGPFTASGATARDGQVAVNPSGGLIARGHPIGATGILMLNEVALQLRGEAGDVQVPGDPRIGLIENGGGITGNDVAVCAVTVLEGAD
ncbi:MAG TPA: thiolase family protein [Baekduia sp.]|nr:thiolase family protein [Baekduia sp.]